MIYFAEVNKTGGEHEVINSCLLQMLRNIYPDEKIIFWGDEKHFDKLKIEHLPEKRFLNIKSPRDGNKAYWVWKYLCDITLMARVLRSAKRNKVTLLFFSSLSVPQQYVLNKLTKTIFTDIPIIVTLHGELFLLNKNSQYKRVDKVLGIIFQRSLSNPSRAIKFLILGEAIKRDLISKGFFRAEQLIGIEHPYSFQERGNVLVHDIPTFGHVGVAKRSKNSHLFFNLAKAFESDILKKRARFVLAGRRVNDFEKVDTSLVEYGDTPGFLARDAFERRIEEIDYAIFFYKDSQYEMVGSGAIMDALSHEKPILALENTFLADLFSSSEKDKPGWLFKNVNELKQKVADIIAGREKNHYKRQVEAIRVIKERFLLKNVQKKLALELQRIGYRK